MARLVPIDRKVMVTGIAALYKKVEDKSISEHTTQ